MVLLTEVAAVTLAGLSFVLAGLGAMASRRYDDARFGLVAAGLSLVGLVGVLAELHELSPRYGGPFAIAATPLFLLVVAVACVYAALVQRGPRTPAT